jgi:hypothetical protein
MQVRFALVLDHAVELDPDHWHASSVAATRTRLRLQHDGHVILLPRNTVDERIEDVVAEHAVSGATEPAGIYLIAPVGTFTQTEGGAAMEEWQYDPELPVDVEVDCTSPHQLEHFLEVTRPGEPSRTEGEASGVPHTYHLEKLPQGTVIRVGIDFFGSAGVPFRGHVRFSQPGGGDPQSLNPEGSGTGAVDLEVIVV